MAVTITFPESCLCSTERLTAAAKRWRFLRKLKRYDQMDFQFALWQMVHLIIGPRKVYRNFVSRKETKNQFARDDPAFLVLLAGFLCLSSGLITLVLGLGFLGFVKFFLWSVFVDCIATGLVVATVMWAITNQFFRADPALDVEWGYSFDIHLNGTFAFLVFIHILQPLFYYPVLNAWDFVGTFLSNTLYLLACTYYLYITFLGYSSVPFLKSTKRLLSVFPIMVLLYIVSLSVGWNISRTVMNFYHYRVM
ncbi:Protein unc-50-like protein A [Hypsibius exemplaris]|uniref:Protein unc-50-like protein A n=1 Tax=Hypsibius exemplaris TaxID=2072580 RepID=A0A1W0WZ32_HYPEX|nr:Protein unc-50-like protein A [Hypsibius exemplaris]